MEEDQLVPAVFQTVQAPGISDDNSTLSAFNVGRGLYQICILEKTCMMGGLCLPLRLYKDNSQGPTLHPCHCWYLFRNLYRQKQSLQVMNFFPTLNSCPMSPGSPSLSLLPKCFRMSLLWGELKFPNKFSFACICWLIIRAHFILSLLGCLFSK